MKINHIIILGFVLVVLISIGVGSYVSFKNIEDLLVKETFNKLDIEAQNKELEVFTLLETQIANLRYLSQDPTIVGLTEIMVDPEGIYPEDEQWAAQRKLKRQLVNFGDFYGGSGLTGGAYADIMIADLEGFMWIGSYGPDEGGNEFDTEWFQKGIKSLYLGDISYNPTMFQTTQIAANPILNSEGKIIGALQLETNVRGLNQIISQRGFESDSGETYLVNSKKIMVTDSRFITNAQGNQVIDTILVNELITSSENVLRKKHLDYRGIEVFGSAHKFGGDIQIRDKDLESLINNLNWLIVGEIDVEEVYEKINSSRNEFLFTGVILALIVSIAAFFTARKVSQPIIYLTEKVDKITRGNLEIQLEESDISEINKLVESLNRILASMKLAILRTGVSKKEVGIGNHSADIPAQEKVSKPLKKIEAPVQDEKPSKSIPVPKLLKKDPFNKKKLSKKQNTLKNIKEASEGELNKNEKN